MDDDDSESLQSNPIAVHHADHDESGNPQIAKPNKDDPIRNDFQQSKSSTLTQPTSNSTGAQPNPVDTIDTTEIKRNQLRIAADANRLTLGEVDLTFDQFIARYKVGTWRDI